MVRRADGTWSSPVACGCFGISYGAQIGIEISEYVIALNDFESLKCFCSLNISIGIEVHASCGAVGRVATMGGHMSIKQDKCVLTSYSLSSGLFLGASVDIGCFFPRHALNTKFYGRKISPEELLFSNVYCPVAALCLYEALREITALTVKTDTDHHPLQEGTRNNNSRQYGSFL